MWDRRNEERVMKFLAAEDHEMPRHTFVQFVPVTEPPVALRH